MRTWTAEKLGAVAGVGFVVLNVIGNLIAGAPPGTGDSPAKVEAFFHNHHRAVDLAVILTGIAAVLFVWLIAALALRLRALGQGSWAVVVFAVGAVGAALATAADGLLGSLAHVNFEGNATLTKGIYVASGFLTTKAFWFAASLGLAVAIAWWRTLPRWYALASLVEAVLAGLGGIAVRQSGFLAPLGGLTLIAFLALLVWALLTSYVVWQSAATGEPRGAAAGPTV